MWIVQLALKRPYTFVVAALLLLIISPVAILRTPVDIFPNIDIPVVSIVFQYTGLASSDFEGRITWPYERVLTTTVNDIEHIESQSLNGIAVIKVFFQPHAKIEMALAQVTAISQTILKSLPTGTTAPLIITYNASSVPILQLGMSSESLPEQQLNDYALNFVRTALSTIPGCAIPYPFGGKMPQMMIDIDPAKLSARGLSPTDVVNAVSVQNLVLPSGTAKIGQLESDVEMNASPKTLPEIANLPIKAVNGSMIYIRDVASVRAGFQVQTNIVHQDGQRGTLLSVYKTGTASTLDIARDVRAALPQILTTLPPDLHIKALFDQSIFVRASVEGVIKEAIIAAALTALMILLFLGNWRHTLVIAISIPLSILASIVTLSALGETINIMTLSGLALAVGILVDDATVTIENIDRHLEEGKELTLSILDGAAEIALPALVSTLCICIVFVPMFFLAGVARYLFVPLAEAVVFAMLASYILSRTLVPTLVLYFLSGQAPHGHGETPAAEAGFFRRFQQGFERGFTRMRDWYTDRLEACLKLRWTFILVFLGLCLASMLLLLSIGQDFFPAVDAGQFKLHMRARTATRIEETASLADQVEKFIRTQIPPDEVATILDNIGLPYSGINTSYANNGTIGTADVEILCALNQEHHGPTANYIAKLRRELPEHFPGVEFFFQPADIVSQILNFGLSAPIDVQFIGRDVQGNLAVARDVTAKIRQVPGAVDVHIYQLFNQPKLHLTVDRSKAEQLGMTERDVANSLLISLSNSFQVSPSFFLNPVNGVSYNLAAQAPQYRIESLSDLEDLPITSANGTANQLMVNLATTRREEGAAVATHYDIKPVVDVLASVQGRDLGGVAHDVTRIVNEARPKLPRGSQLIIRGQVQTMLSSFQGLAYGLVFAVVLVYLLIVVNFQSWVDPFIIITGLPGALAGISWMLFLTGTTLSVPALMGAIMCIGVATANSILVVTFARERFAEHGGAVLSALEAGRTRLRPVIMTALAMIIGMVPMSLGLGEGGEQNAPLGRAVIGGLLMSTVATLFFVPVVFAVIRGRGAKNAACTSGAGSQARAGIGRQFLILFMSAIAIPPPGAGQEKLRATPARRSGGGLLWIGVIVALLVVGALLWKRSRSEAALAESTHELATQTVAVTLPGEGPADNEIVLPGNVMAFNEASIYARTNGYLKSWSTDIGAKVTEGEVMAEIEAPDVDAQLRQADANLEQARANLEIANLNFDREKDLLAKKVASQQEYDQDRTNVDAMKAALDADQANVQNLTVQKNFQEIKAPFAGIVTRRNTDVGALINATNGGQELFRVARTDILRVYVYVPEAYAAFVQLGSKAYLTFAEFPGEKFEGKVANIAGALDPAVRTLQTEIQIDNKDGRLFPGAYANVRLFLPLKKSPMVVPVNTILFRKEGMQVGVVDDKGIVHLRKVTVGQDYGTSLEVTGGLSPQDRIVVNPSDSLADGAQVQVATPAAKR